MRFFQLSLVHEFKEENRFNQPHLYLLYRLAGEDNLYCRLLSSIRRYITIVALYRNTLEYTYIVLSENADK